MTAYASIDAIIFLFKDKETSDQPEFAYLKQMEKQDLPLALCIMLESDIKNFVETNTHEKSCVFMALELFIGNMKNTLGLESNMISQLEDGKMLIYQDYADYSNAMILFLEHCLASLKSGAFVQASTFLCGWKIAQKYYVALTTFYVALLKETKISRKKLEKIVISYGRETMIDFFLALNDQKKFAEIRKKN